MADKYGIKHTSDWVPNQERVDMIRKILTRNKKKFLEYNTTRKVMFTEYSPRDSELILYLLPWLISVNHPNCPGFLSDLKVPIRIFGINNDREIKKREDQFKDIFNISEKGTLLKPIREYNIIQGVYTIGSVGTISQTSDSDCDIWVCYNSEDFNGDQTKKLRRKLYLIKEWLSRNCRLPVYFFVLDVNDIRACRFGSVDEESSGSTQKNVLKEEFYRTCVVICGKIPLWWTCFGNKDVITYELAAKELVDNPLWDDDLIDLGNLEKVEEHEYFGAALWQLNKALERPLKSIIKMLMLKMQLDASNEELVCHKFRQHILIKNLENMIPDPSLFSMIFVMNFYQGKSDPDTISFIKECFYLRCGIKSYTHKYDSKKELADIFFDHINIDRTVRERLDRFSSWDLESQIRFGKQIFMLILEIYRDIAKSHSGVVTQVDKEDLTVIGRKIQIFYENKEYKIPILPKPMDRLNISGLTIHLDEGRWHVYSGNTRGGHIVSDMDILYVITFIVNNGLYDPVRMHMLPNRSSVSLPEIQSLALKIKEFIFQDHSVNRSDYLKKEYITKALAVVSFEEEPWGKNTSNMGIIYKNSWGEVYVRRFNTEKRLKEFVEKFGIKKGRVHCDYYLQKKCINYSILLSDARKIIQG